MKLKKTICQGERIENLMPVACGREAKQVRGDWVFANDANGEATVLKTEVPLCDECAEMWDERMDEGRCEAEAS